MTLFRAPPRSLAALLLFGLGGALGCDPGSARREGADASSSAPVPRGASSAEIDLGSILDFGFAFRPVGGRLEGGGRSYRAIVSGDGLALIALHDPFGEGVRASPELSLVSARARVGHRALSGVAYAPRATTEGVVVERGWATERLVCRAGGLEQTWTFGEAPRGPGALVVRIDAPSLALVATDEAGLHLAPAPGELGLVYGHGTWVDADGARTPIEARWVDGGIELEVPEEVLARTRWPAVLDPVIGPEVGPGVSTYVVGAERRQEQSDLAAGPSGGGALAVWTDGRRRSNAEVWASRIGPAGEVLDPVGVFVAGGDAGVADVTVAYGGGVYLVAWAQGGVFARRMAPSGAFLDAAPIEIGGVSTSQLDAVFDGTDFVVAWEDGPYPDHDLYAARVSVDGAVRDPSPLVLAAEPGGQLDVALAAVPDGVIAVWWDTRTDGGDVFGSRIAGGAVLDPGGVPLASGADVQRGPTISASGSDVVIAWRVEHRIHAASLDPVSLALTPTWTGASALLHGPPAMASASSGHLLAWVEVSSAGTVTRAIALEPSGRPSGSPQELRRGRRGVVEAMVFDGNAYLATQGETVLFSLSDEDVLLLRIASAGVLESSVVLSSGFAAQRDGALAPSGGAYLLAWAMERGATGGLDLLAMRIAGDGTRIDAVPLEIDLGAGHQRSPAVAGDGAGGWLVAWESERRTASGGREVDVYARTVSASGTLGATVEVERGGVLSGVAATGGPSGYLVAYLRGADVLARRVTTSGAVLDASPLHPGSGGAGAEELAALFDGAGFQVMWSSSPGTISGALVSTSGLVTPLGVVARETRGPIQSLALAHGDGSTLLTWISLSSATSTATVRGLRVSAAGGPMGSVFDVVTSDVIVRSSSAVFEGTDFFVSYTSWQGAHGARITTSGAVRDIGGLTLVGGRAYDAQLASTGDGRALLVYTRFDEAAGSELVRGRVIDFTQPGDDPVGAPCGSSWECAGGSCVDGVCCDAACTGGCEVCAASAGASADGACTIVAAGAECRRVRGVCDLAEMCDGVSGECPADGFVAAGTICGEPATDACDVDDACTGESPDCATAARRPSGAVCREASGACDVAETCDGIAAACPPDAVRGGGETCRTASGECDVEESCDGASVECPSDARVEAGTECRASGGACDVAETCDGVTASCPPDVLVPAGMVCRAAIGVCDREELCSGSDASCPSDRRVFAGTVCRESAGPCDRFESCDGTSGLCPEDVLRAAGSACRASTGACDLRELCDGTSVECPPDAHRAEGTPCDDGLTCNGTSTCEAGACIDGAPVSCEEGEECVEALGACEPAPRIYGGCGCRATPPARAGWPSLLGLLAIIVRRRRCAAS